MSSRELSWLLPVRNGACWLRRAVDSILAEADSEDEIVIVDDGSDDQPEKVLPSDSRIRLLRTEKRGIVQALEAGRALATGEFLARLDADDRVLPGRRSAQLKALRADARLAVVGGRARLVSEAVDPPMGMQSYVEWVNAVEDVHRELLVESPIFHPAATLRAEAVAAVSGYKEGPFAEDYDLWLRLAERGYRLANVPECVVELEDHSKRLTRSDPRYGREGFDLLRRRHLRATLLHEKKRVAIWCGPRDGRAWIRFVQSEGHELLAVIDIGKKQSLLGHPIQRPECLGALHIDLLLVVVGNRGARALIRAEIAKLRPEFVEGRDWVALR